MLNIHNFVGNSCPRSQSDEKRFFICFCMLIMQYVIIMRTWKKGFFQNLIFFKKKHYTINLNKYKKLNIHQVNVNNSSTHDANGILEQQLKLQKILSSQPNCRLLQKQNIYIW